MKNVTPQKGAHSPPKVLTCDGARTLAVFPGGTEPKASMKPRFAAERIAGERWRKTQGAAEGMRSLPPRNHPPRRAHSPIIEAEIVFWKP